MSSYECSSDEEIYVDINDKVSKLNRGMLTLPENNELLVEALEYDDYCLKKLQTQPILSKTCEYGAKLSGIVLDKAFQINVYDTRESLNIIIDSLLLKFPSIKEYNKHLNPIYNDFNNSLDSKDPCFMDEDLKNDEVDLRAVEVHTPIRSNPLATDAPLESRIQLSKQNQMTPKKITCRELDFISMSKYFYGSSLRFSSLEWDVMPIGKQPVQKQQRKRIPREKIESNTLNLDTISHTKEEIENCILVDKLIAKLQQSTSDKPLPFWKFILDTDKINGFNNTCYNLYALTLIVSKGYASITSINNKLYIQIANKNDSIKGNSQQILTGWSYDKWKSLINDIN